MGKREKFNETSLPDKKIFYSKLNLKVNLLVKTMRKDYVMMMLAHHPPLVPRGGWLPA